MNSTQAPARARRKVDTAGNKEWTTPQQLFTQATLYIRPELVLMADEALQCVWEFVLLRHGRPGSVHEVVHALDTTVSASRAECKHTRTKSLPPFFAVRRFASLRIENDSPFIVGDFAYATGCVNVCLQCTRLRMFMQDVAACAAMYFAPRVHEYNLLQGLATVINGINKGGVLPMPAHDVRYPNIYAHTFHNELVHMIVTWMCVTVEQPPNTTLDYALFAARFDIPFTPLLTVDHLVKAYSAHFCERAECVCDAGRCTFYVLPRGLTYYSHFQREKDGTPIECVATGSVQFCITHGRVHHNLVHFGDRCSQCDSCRCLVSWMSFNNTQDYADSMCADASERVRYSATPQDRQRTAFWALITDIFFSGGNSSERTPKDRLRRIAQHNGSRLIQSAQAHHRKVSYAALYCTLFAEVRGADAVPAYVDAPLKTKQVPRFVDVCSTALQVHLEYTNALRSPQFRPFTYAVLHIIANGGLRVNDVQFIPDERSVRRWLLPRARLSLRVNDINPLVQAINKAYKWLYDRCEGDHAVLSRYVCL